LNSPFTAALLDRLYIAEVVGSNLPTQSISYDEGITALDQAHFWILVGQKTHIGNANAVSPACEDYIQYLC
jgi:hypothetical protein